MATAKKIYRHKGSVGRRPKSLKRDADSRTAILKAARLLFARRGVDGTSVRDVADIAKVNTAMIYYHFKDKTGLYRAVLQYSFSALDRIWEHPVFRSNATARQKMQKYVEEFIRFQHANEDLRRIMTMEHAACCGENSRWLADVFFRDHYEKMVTIFKQGMRTGELKKNDPKIMISSLLGIIIHNFVAQPIAEYVIGKKIDLSVRKFGSFVTELFFDGLAAAPRSSGKR